MSASPYTRFSGKDAEEWVKKFSRNVQIESLHTFNLEKVIKLLSTQLPKRFDNGLCDLDADFPEGDRWINQVLRGNTAVSLPDQTQKAFAAYLLDQIASTDLIVELPGQDGQSERIAIDVTLNERQTSSKIGKIKGLPDSKDKPGENRNQNISKVRRELGITKHLLLTLDSKLPNLPSYDTLLSELKTFAKSPSVTGSLNLKNLPPEQTIGGAYQQLAALHPIDNEHQRLTAIANQSIANGDHPYFTAQILLNDPASLKLEIDEARGLAAKYTSHALECTPHYQIAAAVQYILKQQGKRVEGGTVLDAGKRTLTQTDAGYSIYDKENQALLFRSDKLKAKVFKLDPTESNRYLKYFNANVKNKQTTRQSRGLRQ